MNTEPSQRKHRDAADFSEDTTGFGVRELRTVKDLLLRPRAVLEAYMQDGATGGGRYARPLRLYLALCGIMTLILLLKGGSNFITTILPADLLQRVADQSGKSLEAFINDAENWFSFALIPISCAFYALVAVPLIRWWDPEDLGWRRGFRATFAYLSAWSVMLLPFTWWSNEQTPAGSAVTLLTFVLALVTFIRMGYGRWFRNVLGGLFKGVCLMILIYVSALIAMVPLLAIAYAGATFIA